MDGDTLLTDDQSFPYSDKDFELICGSLVTIRKGTLQVIHLTVKEFLRSRHETDSSDFSRLLVDPEHGSLQLTLVCLRCISINAEPLVDLESKAPRIDWALDTGAIDRCQARAPLLEYASFSWLVHLIDCKLDDLLEITPTFQKTFDSPTTFFWVETCMVLQPDSTLRLLVGIDEVRDGFYNPTQNPWPRQEVSSQFLASWCIAMVRVFEEYGAILARRPWEIYFIDLCDTFSADPNLRKLWQEFGETPLREKDLQLNGYRAPRPPQEKPQPHLQLQNNLQAGPLHEGSVFLVHNESQNIYIWGEILIKGDKYCISVQHGETGQRLPPAEDFSGPSDQQFWLIDREMSPNGRYLALIYKAVQRDSKAALDPCELTVVWQIDENISFKRRMNCEPWARVVSSHASNCALFEAGSRAVMFKDDSHCITPSGMLDLITGSRRPLPDGLPDEIGPWTRLFYSCNGQYLFASGIGAYPLIVRRIDPFEPSLFVDFSCEDKRRSLVDVSPTGRYLVLEVEVSLDFLERDILYLYDTDCNETIELHLPHPLEYWGRKFHFSRHETRLIAFLMGQPIGLSVIIWDCLTAVPRLTSHEILHPESFMGPLQIYVHQTATSAVIVTNTRSIHRVELGNNIEFLDAKEVVDDYPHRLSTISMEGSRWASVSYGREGGYSGV